MVWVDLEVAGQVDCLMVGSSDRRIAGIGFRTATSSLFSPV